MAKKKTKPEKQYNAAGLTKDAVTVIVNDAEYACMGLKGYPWEKALKTKIIKKADGLKTRAEIDKLIADLSKPEVVLPA